jgi:hypothetical protein
MKSSVDRDNNVSGERPLFHPLLHNSYVITSFYKMPASQLRYIIIRNEV